LNKAAIERKYWVTSRSKNKQYEVTDEGKVWLQSKWNNTRAPGAPGGALPERAWIGPSAGITWRESWDRCC